jgi:NAD(P)-dependent dehydrogenase (short-subunit alcohol dehydrogenase family)
MTGIFSVTDKRVIVTGASRGLGLAVARGFLEAGSKVLSVARTETLEKIKNSERSHFIFVDLASEKAPETVVTAALKFMGGIDVLINCAGVSLSSETYSVQDFDKTLELNLRAPFRLSKAVAEQLQSHGGSIINITSIAAEQGFPNNPGYVASKGGLAQLTQALARDWGTKNIRVNNIAPGYFHTDMTTKSFNNNALRDERSARTILGRWGKPEDLIGPCLFLASEASAYITGTTIAVDGGWLAKGL